MPPLTMNSARFRLKLTLFTGLAAISVSAAGATATSRTPGMDSTIRTLNTTPVAVRGGLTVLPLTRDNDQTPWPRHLALTLADGRTISGQVALFQPLPIASGTSSWTADPRRVSIRAADQQSASTPAASAVLLVPLPADADGELRLGPQRVTPVWHDRPPAPMTENSRPTLQREPALNRPDPNAPLEHWRWVLLADRLGLQPPPASAFDPLAAMLAQHFADLWHIALARLRAEHPGLALHVRDLLTRLCTDGQVEFAAWVADTAQTNALLDHLLRSPTTTARYASEVVKWIEQHERTRFWVESDAGDTVRLAIINPGTKPSLVRFDWVGSALPPLAVEVQPGTLRRVVIDRPDNDELERRRPLQEALAARRPAPPDVLAVTVNGQTGSIPLGPRSIPVTPPGYWLPPLRPSLTLAEVQGAQPIPVPIDRATIAHVRRLRGRWEVFIECRRNPTKNLELSEERRAAGDFSARSIDEARGQESLIILVGSTPHRPENILLIPESGWHHMTSGSSDGTLQVYRRSQDDRWTCRVVLPDAWLGMLPGELTHLAVMRTQEGESAIWRSPSPAVPWETTGATTALDLSAWTDLPQ